MTAMRLVAIARGVGLRWSVILLATIGAACAAALVSIQLRTAADRLLASPVLDTAVIVGLVLPVTVLGRTTEDRAAWLLATSSRPLWRIRLGWTAILYLAGGAVSIAGAMIAPGQQPAKLMVADELFLLATAMISAVAFGASLCWLLPVAAALAASSPGLIPLQANWLVLADRAGDVGRLDAVMLLLGAAAFVALDDYGLAPARRLVARTPGVTDE